MPTPPWLRAADRGAVVMIRVQPKASRTEIVGPHGEPPRLKIRVAAPPVEGEANRVLIEFLSKRLSIPKSRIEILRGDSGKSKDVLCNGLTLEQAESRLMEPG